MYDGLDDHGGRVDPGQRHEQREGSGDGQDKPEISGFSTTKTFLRFHVATIYRYILLFKGCEWSAGRYTQLQE